MKSYQQLQVRWQTHVDDFLLEEFAATLPADIVRSVTGATLFEEQMPQLTPLHLRQFDEQMVAASQRLIAAHTNRYAASELVRLQVRAFKFFIFITEFPSHLLFSVLGLIKVFH